MKKVLYLRIILSVVASAVLCWSNAGAQVHRVGGGLLFASGVDLDTGETGNPGITAKTWLALDKGSYFHIVPSLSIYNPYHLETGRTTTNNYMFQGDLDLQFTIFQENTVNLVTLGGGNFTYLYTSFEEQLQDGAKETTKDHFYAVGGNLGAGLELHMAPKWDFILSGKYIISRYSQFIISVQAVYYFKRRSAYRR